MKWKDHDVSDIEWDEIDHKDYPDYCDAHIIGATIDGRDATEEEINEMNEDDDWAYDRLMDHIF